MPPNLYLLAADDSPSLVPYLREHPGQAAAQDEHGYSLVHAAASYNHLTLLRTLIRDFRVPVDLRDEDGETALFVVETAEAARVLVEELGLDAGIKNDEGQTAQQKIEQEDEFPAVAEYLLQAGSHSAPDGPSVNGTSGVVNGVADVSSELPPVPEGLAVTFTEALDPDEAPDPEFRRRIEQLAAREDFHTAEGQAELRRLVEEAISGEGLTEERNVRQRQS